jgi:subtilisin family serine protease
MFSIYKYFGKTFFQRLTVAFLIVALSAIGILQNINYVLAENSQPQAVITTVAGATQQIEIALSSSYSPAIFAADPEIISYKALFAGESNPTLAATYLITAKESPQQFAAKYEQAIKYAESPLTLSSGSVTANDPGFTTSWSDTDHQWALQKAGFVDAWSKTTGKTSTVVAVIDTGIDGQHEDLSSGQVAAGYNFLTSTAIAVGADSDDNGHGTLVAGVIGATANNFRGIVGTNWNVTMMPLKALDQKGEGNSTNVAQAIVYAADHGANIINLSLGGTQFTNDTTLADAITYAYNKDVTIVAAAGNDVASDGGNMDINPVYPVCDDNGQDMVIGVAATDNGDQKAAFSNFGKSCVDVSAPGKRILSTISIDPSTGAVIHNGYAYADGTSLAAPFVSGEAALIKSLYPDATNQEITYRIVASADPIDLLNPTQCAGQSCAGLIGSGRINAAAALQPNLIQTNLADGTVVHLLNSTTYYYISGGQKHQISPFVMQQRFSETMPIAVSQFSLNELPNGAFAPPLDATNIKASGSPIVYQMVGGIKRPITYQVFQQLGIDPTTIATLSDQEISSWLTGTFLPPKEGTLVRTANNPTVYWVIDGLLHPINYAYWSYTGLNIFPVMIISDNDLNSYSQGNAYVR